MIAREIYKTMVFSTGHITEADGKKLNDVGNARRKIVDVLPYGWRLHISSDDWEAHRQGLKGIGLSEALLQAMDLAHLEGCLWAEFDEDGEVYDDLEKFDW